MALMYAPFLQRAAKPQSLPKAAAETYCVCNIKVCVGAVHSASARVQEPGEFGAKTDHHDMHGVWKASFRQHVEHILLTLLLLSGWRLCWVTTSLLYPSSTCQQQQLHNNSSFLHVISYTLDAKSETFGL
jgi:hypothetical protein